MFHPDMGILGPMPIASRSLLAGAAVATLALTTGCGSQQPAAMSVATKFVQALGNSNPTAACRYLAPKTKADLESSAGKACPAALTEEKMPSPGPVKDSKTFGTMAQVRFAKDTLFIARFNSGWKVMAAGCKPQPGQPYDCQLKGG
jgi:hypothetical protein